MASKDFRADRVRIKAIVGTGSIENSHPYLGLMVYSSSNASNFKGGRLDGNMLQNVGSDVWMFVSGSASGDGTYKADQRPAGGAVLFAGDVVVSGTLWAERSIIEVDGTVEGDLRVPNSIIQGGVPNLKDGRALIFADPLTPNEAEPNKPGNISFKIVQGTAGAYNYSTTQNKDVFFHVSGSRGVRNTNDRGLSLFEGDVHLSGNLSTATVATANFGGDVIVSGGLFLSGNAIYDSSATEHNIPKSKPGYPQAVLRFDGNRRLFGNVELTGSEGVDSAMIKIRGNTLGAAQFRLQSDKQVMAGDDVGTIMFTGRVADAPLDQYPGGIIAVTASQNWGFSGGPRAPSEMHFKINDGAPNAGPETRFLLTANTTISSQATVSASLKVHGGGIANNAKIVDQNDQTAVFFSGSVGLGFPQHATFDQNVTVLGDLNVSGSVASINTTNLKIKDQLILLATGSETSNTAAGIAITSGSSYTNEALVMGTGLYPNSWRASRLDVQDGNRTTGLETGEPVRIEAAGLRFMTDVTDDAKMLLITSSLGGDTYYHITASNNNGGILLDAKRSITLNSEADVFITKGQKLYFDNTAGNNRYIQAGSSDDLIFYNESRVFKFQSESGVFDKIQFSSDDYGDSPNRIISVDGAPFSTKRSSFFISGSGEMRINNRAAAPGAGIPVSLTTIISASADEVRGGPVIILSSSAEYGGGSSREGFVTIGDSASAVNSLFTISRHRDVRTLLSGTVGTRGSNTRGVTLVAGDLVVSGNTQFVGATDIGSISTDNLTLDSVTSGEPFLRFRSSDTQIRRNTAAHLEFTDTQVPGSTRTLTQLAANAVTNNADVLEVTHQTGVAPYLSYVATTASFSFDHDPTTNGHAARRTNQIGSDVYFFVSGSIGSKDDDTRAGNGQRGTAVFGGDIHVSGAIYAGDPRYFVSLHTAYTTPDTPGLKSFSELTAGAGAVIDTNRSGIPLQLRNPALDSAPGVNDSFGPVLSLTGSLDFAHGGGANNPRIRIQTSNALGFHNSAGEVFRLMNGGSGTHAKFPSNNELRFNQDTIRIYGVHSTPHKKLKLISDDSTGGQVHIQAGTEPDPGMVAVSGSMHVRGNVLPNASSTYNLGSPTQTWANVYTGDLHLNNDRGSWTIYEEPDMLVVVNNLTGKKYKMGLTPLEDDE
ncbi:MAG: hypothetical protein CMF51_04460 [Legionellales bacterium]|nr:hypothetical protein [Legionellales bacterium]